MVWDNLVLPVVNHAIPLLLLRFIVLILDIHPGVVGEIPDGELGKLFRKALLSIISD